jgi:hypothetical protein
MREIVLEEEDTPILVDKVKPDATVIAKKDGVTVGSIIYIIDLGWILKLGISDLQQKIDRNRRGSFNEFVAHLISLGYRLYQV